MMEALELKKLSPLSPMRRCVVVLLRATGWTGDPDYLSEYFVGKGDESQILNGFSHMHYKAQVMKIRLDAIEARLLPCIFVPLGGDPTVLLSERPGLKKPLQIYSSKNNIFSFWRSYANCTL